MAVYPRWRGEHPGGVIRCWEYLGLSPLARGTLPGAPFRTARGRFIPAGAGNTHETPRTRSRRSVYPRWRGEHPCSI